MELQKHRISTNIGKDQFLTINLENSYDLLEILSLKFTQTDIYRSFCSDYGVVCGRITSNNGFGIPNCRVSIFVPIKDSDTTDPVISALYPYTSVADKDENNYRYNLLPARKQHGGHVPTGTFPDQEDILTREEVLQVYHDYYNFTVKTNDAGDFMIWGVPLGQQTIHVDVDLSDMGCFSIRPYDFIRQGVSENNFDRFYNFKSDTDIDGLPQIVKFDKTIQVVPFWGNKDICQLGITRVDFDLSEKGIKIQPISLLLLSTVTDDDGDAVKRTGVIRKKSGYKCNLKTRKGQVEGVRYKTSRVIGSDGVSIYPELEYFDPGVIDEDGSAMLVIPMNMEYTYTNEFGEQEITNDPNKGIATTTTARFRVGLDVGNVSSFKGTEPAYYLIPNIREFNTHRNSHGDLDGANEYGEYDENMLSSYVFSDVFEDYFRVPTPTGSTLTLMTDEQRNHKRDLMLGVNNNDIPEDTFYKFIYGKVYTPSSFQGTHYEVSSLESFFGLSRRDAFLGIKEIRPNAEDDCPGTANYIPTNYGFRNRIKFGLLVNQILLFIQFIFTVIFIKVFEFLGNIFFTIGENFYSVYFGWPFNWRPFEKIGEIFKNIGYVLQDKGTKVLPLTVYPECEECSEDSAGLLSNSSFVDRYCSIGEVKCKVFGVGSGIGYGDYDIKLIPIDINVSTTSGTTFLSGTSSSSIETSARSISYTGTPYNPSGYTAQTLNITTLQNLQTKRLDPWSMIQGNPNDSRFVAVVYPYVDDTILPYSATSRPLTGNTKSTSFNDVPLYFNDHGQDIEVNNLISFGSRTYKYSDDNGIDDPWTTYGHWFGTNKVGNYYDTRTNKDLLYDYINIYGDSYFSGTTHFIYDDTTTLIASFFSQESFSDYFGLDYSQYTNKSNPQYGDTGKYAVNGDGTIRDLGLYAIVKIYDIAALLNPSSNSGTTLTIESGCQKYDKLYDENTSLAYLWANKDVEYGDPYIPHDPDSGFNPSDPHHIDGYYIGKTKPVGPSYSDYTIMADISANENTNRLPRYVNWNRIADSFFDRKTKTGLSEVRDGVFTCIPVIKGKSNNLNFILEWYKRKRVHTFFCGGVLNYSYVDNWLNGLLYMFKFDFRIKWDDPTIYDLNQRGSKFPRELIYYDVYKQKFYYRSTPYNPDDQTFTGQWDSGGFKGLIRPTTIYDVGVRDEFLYEICYDPRVDPTCSVIRDIGSTSYQDPAYIIEHVIDYRMDVSNAKTEIDDFFSKSQWGSNDPSILATVVSSGAINGISSLLNNAKVLDGDITQLMSINNEAGIEAFDLDVPHYFNYNNEFMDPENTMYSGYFGNTGLTGQWGPTPIDFKLDADGRFVRLCLNNRLGDYTQKVPLYLWEKYGEGFGASGSLDDQQTFIKNPDIIATMKLQRMISIGSETGTTTNYVMADGEEEYMLKPMTKDHPTFKWQGNYGSSIERFEYIKYSVTPNLYPGTASGETEGDLWLNVTGGTFNSVGGPSGTTYVVVNKTWTPMGYYDNNNQIFLPQTVNNYTGTRQVLSTGFHFYFGLRPGQTSYNKLIKHYGPKGAFPPVN